MILRDRVVIATAGEVIGYDEYGSPIIGPPVLTTVRGTVFPLGTEELLAAGYVATRYRMVLHRSAVFPPTLNDDMVLRFGWNKYQLDPVNPFGVASGLRLDGSVEVHTLGGRLHHYELITKTVQ